MTDGKPRRTRRSAEQMLVELKQRLRIGPEPTNLNSISLNAARPLADRQSGARAGGRSGARQVTRLARSLWREPANDSDDASLIRVAHREYQKKIKVPPTIFCQAFQLLRSIAPSIR